MTVPKFLIGDNSEHQDAIFVVHTEFPRFVIDLTKDEIEWMEEFDSQDENELATETENAIKEATDFYDAEIATYEDN
jgi:hypothetical protein